ncbi:MAG: cupin-like domain-containing protein [Minicystis sp.]
MQAGTSRLDPQWQQWLAENLALGASPDDLAGALCKGGISEAVAREEIAAVAAHPFVQAGRSVGRRYARMEALMDLYSDLHRQAGMLAGVDRRAGISGEEFFARYYFGHRPVVLEGLMEDWPARRRWSLSDLRDRCGGVEVEIMSGRDADPDHAFQHDRHRAVTTLADFIQRIEEAGESNDLYMVPRNENWRREGLRPLLSDLRAPRGIIDPALDPTMMSLLLGPAGTVTPLHHDNMNVLLAQVFGRKRVKLVPSFELHRVYPRRGTFSHVDAERPDPERHPDFLGASLLDVVVEPGEMLFIPVGWWHWVRALDASATVTFHHFMVPEGNTHLFPPT